MVVFRVLLLLVTVVLAVVIMSLLRGSTDPQDTTNTTTVSIEPLSKQEIWSDHKTCQQCHANVYQEWESSMHAKAWSNSFVQFALSGNKDSTSHGRQSDCKSCHAPTEISKLVEDQKFTARTDNLDSGVNCLTCHQENEDSKSNHNEDGSCNAATGEVISTAKFCASCHSSLDQSMHEYEEWLERSQISRDKTCMDCHMAEQKRTATKFASSRIGYSHAIHVSQNPAFLRTAFEIKHEFSANKVKIGIVNKGTGHKLPSGRNRVLFMIVKVMDKNDQVVSEHRQDFAKSLDRHVKTTQLKDGETRVFEYSLDAVEEGVVVVELYFKVSRYDLEDKLTPIYTRTLNFN